MPETSSFTSCDVEMAERVAQRVPLFRQYSSAKNRKIGRVHSRRSVSESDIRPAFQRRQQSQLTPVEQPIDESNT